jgi:hypothetical protein
MNHEGWGVQRWAIHLSQLLNAANPPNRYRFDVGALAKEVSKNFFPDDPIAVVAGTDLDDCEGALLPSTSGKRWGIYYNLKGSRRRRRFTAAHEFGHYLLHRKKYPEGLRSDEAGVDGRTRIEIEREANEFAATLLMPLDDFRRQIPAKNLTDFDQLSACAARYDVSLVAAILRWLRYTERRAVIVVSVDGFMKWAWSSDPALKSGRYFRTKGQTVEVPALSCVGKAEFNDEARSGVIHPPGVWFDEPVKEFSIRSEKYDLNYTLLHLSNEIQHVGMAEPHVEDTFDRFEGSDYRA